MYYSGFLIDFQDADGKTFAIAKYDDCSYPTEMLSSPLPIFMDVGEDSICFASIKFHNHNFYRHAMATISKEKLASYEPFLMSFPWSLEYVETTQVENIPTVSLEEAARKLSEKYKAFYSLSYSPVICGDDNGLLVLMKNEIEVDAVKRDILDKEKWMGYPVEFDIEKNVLTGGSSE